MSAVDYSDLDSVLNASRRRQGLPPLSGKRLSAADVQAILACDLRSPMDAGRLKAMARRTDDRGEQRLIEQLAAMADKSSTNPENRPAPKPVPLNPVHRIDMPFGAGVQRSDDPLAAALGRRGDRDDTLNAADHAWLGRLPADPKDFTDEKLTQLNAMALRTNNPGERRLLRDILEPLRLVHDKRIRRVQLENAAAEIEPQPIAAVLAAAPSTLRDEFVAVLTGLEQAAVDEARARATAQGVTLPAALDLSEQEVQSRARANLDLSVAARVKAEHAARVGAAKQALAELGNED